MSSNNQRNYVGRKASVILTILSHAITVVLALYIVVLVMQQFLKPMPGWEKTGNGLTAVTSALFFGTKISESRDGRRSVFWVIKNRHDSKDFPNTYHGVVTQGYVSGKKGGCQFTFVCDGIPDDIELHCQTYSKDVRKHWGKYGCQSRWFVYFLDVLIWYVLPGDDPTKGAVLYYNYGARDPYWVGDIVPGTKQKIGSKWFGISSKVGRDVHDK